MTHKPLLPPNPTQGELAQEIVHAHIGDRVIDIRIVKNPELCPLELLPWLAWEFGVTHWDDGWLEAQKRDVIKSATQVNKARGTTGALTRALAATGYDMDVIEWFADNPPAEPYTFRVIVNAAVSENGIAAIIRQINDAKNARSLLSSLDAIPPPVVGEIFVGGTLVTTVTTLIEMN